MCLRTRPSLSRATLLREKTMPGALQSRFEHIRTREGAPFLDQSCLRLSTLRLQIWGGTWVWCPDREGITGKRDREPWPCCRSCHSSCVEGEDRREEAIGLWIWYHFQPGRTFSLTSQRPFLGMEINFYLEKEDLLGNHSFKNGQIQGTDIMWVIRKSEK